MKKTYMNPTLKVVKIQPARILADSIMTMKGDLNSGVTVGARSARFSDFDEEEE